MGDRCVRTREPDRVGSSSAAWRVACQSRARRGRPRGCTHRVVLRRWARRGWELDDPDYTVEREARVLELLRSTPVPAPELVAADAAGRHCDVPAILLTRLGGRPPQQTITETDGFCRQLAETLAAIHDIGGGDVEGQLDAYRLYYDRERAAPARWMPATAVWVRATAAVREPPPATPMTLIHRAITPRTRCGPAAGSPGSSTGRRRPGDHRRSTSGTCAGTFSLTMASMSPTAFSRAIEHAPDAPSATSPTGTS
jgi:phosphotransferase family enzyme